MLKQKYFLADIFILSAEKQSIKSSWRKIVWLRDFRKHVLDTPKDFICFIMNVFTIRPQVGGELWNSVLLSEMKDNIRWKIDGINLFLIALY